MARPTKLTPEVHETIVGMLRKGNFVETAAAAAGVDRETVRRWLRRGASAKSGRFKRFRDDVLAAVSEAEVGLVDLVRKAAKGKRPAWQAAAWMLERKFPERWGRRLKVQAQVTVQGDPFEGRSDEELAFYASHGYFPDQAPEGDQGPEARRG